MITLDNYESYLFLYQEGELDSATHIEVEQFLLQHPDIREEMEQFYDPSFVVTAEPPTPKRHSAAVLWHWAAAACVLLAVGLGVYLLKTESTDNGTLVAGIPAAEGGDTNKTQPTEPVYGETPVARNTTRPHCPAQTTSPTLSANSVAPINTLLEAEPETATIVSPVNHPTTEPDEAMQSAPEYILTDRLALEPILVDNLAVDVPNSSPFPSSEINLTEILMAFSDRKRQELHDFFHRERPQQHTIAQLAQEIY